MKRLFTIIAIGIACLAAADMYAQWPIEMYDRYDYTNYTNYAPFNQRITTTGYDADLLEAAIFYETNRQRALHGRPQFRFEYRLEVSAHNHSVDMVNYDFFSHESPVSGKRTMSDRYAEVGIPSCMSGENIAMRSIGSSYAETAKQLVDQWMNSPGHRANILNEGYTHLGCGVAFYKNYSSVYVKATQNFMRGEESFSLTWTAEEKRRANTASGVTYMTDLEKDVVMYINLARLYPKKFAKLEVEKYEHAEGYGVLPSFPQYKKSLLETLNSMDAVCALQPDYTCYQFAYCWAEESGRLGVIGHDRISCESGYFAECCSYGAYTAIDIALQLLIDDGVPSLGHREICLSTKWPNVGVSHQPHSKWRWCTVLDFK